MTNCAVSQRISSLTSWRGRELSSMVKEMSGFIPRVLRREDGSLLRADETVLMGKEVFDYLPTMK